MSNESKPKYVKIFVISDSGVQFTNICEKYPEEAKRHKMERLVAPTQLDKYKEDELEVWNTTVLYVALAKRGLLGESGPLPME